MTSRLTRRSVLAGALAGAGQAAFAKGPLTSSRPVARGRAPLVVVPNRTDELIASAGLGGAVGFVVADAATGKVLEERLGEARLPPASTMKTITSLYALDRLGEGHAFRTLVLATGPLVDGRLEGDLALVGDGDPTLDTDRMLTLAKAVAEAGIRQITGKFLVWADALPAITQIEDGQPPQVGYNPALGGLNLNFNRVHFTWKRAGDGYETEMIARGNTAAPSTSVARMAIIDRAAPVYEYRASGGIDYWSVRKGALGKEGSRWLPVRNPALYAADVFRTLARGQGVILPPGEMVADRPEGYRVAGVQGAVLPALLKDMLKYSTNLTAEVTGLSATMSDGSRVESLSESGRRMELWAASRFGVVGPICQDHSGLGYGSAVSAADMVRLLEAGPEMGLPALLKPVDLSLSKSQPAPKGVSVMAKTGTLNFTSALVGYFSTAHGDDRIFAIMTADTARRDAVPLDQRDRAEGGRAWAGRSRLLQKQLLREWSARLS